MEVFIKRFRPYFQELAQTFPALVFGLFCCVALFIISVTEASGQKIGYVSTETIKQQYEPYKQAEVRLDAMVNEWKTDLDQQQKDIDDLELEMKKNRLIWTDNERQQKEMEIADKRRKREQFATEKFAPGGEHDKQAESLFQAIWEKIYLAIQKVASDEGYDIVWDKSVDPLVYVNAKYDLTVKVMKQLGISADELEKKQQEVIDADPRNKKLEEPRRLRSRRRSTTPETEKQDTVQAAMPNGPGNLPPAPPPPLPPQPQNPADTGKPRQDEVPR